MADKLTSQSPVSFGHFAKTFAQRDSRCNFDEERPWRSLGEVMEAAASPSAVAVSFIKNDLSWQGYFMLRCIASPAGPVRCKVCVGTTTKTL